ncbi:hypothetical protein [Clostridium coskatii]|nr:hypothetical protein [Clostridium coskatii]
MQVLKEKIRDKILKADENIFYEKGFKQHMIMTLNNHMKGMAHLM